VSDGTWPHGKYFFFRRWYFVFYAYFSTLARITVEPGRVVCWLAPLPVTITHTEPEIRVVRAAAMLGRWSFELVGANGHRVSVCPYDERQLWSTLEAAGFQLREERALMPPGGGPAWRARRNRS